MGLLRDAGVPVFMVSWYDAYGQNLPRPPPSGQRNPLFPQKSRNQNDRVPPCGNSRAESSPSRAVSEDLTQNYPQGENGLFNIGLLHTALTGRKGHEPYAPCTLDGLRSKGYQYWALGHVHAREEVSREPWIIFPEHMQGRHIRETGPKGCTVVTVDEGRVLEVAHCRLTSCDGPSAVWI